MPPPSGAQHAAPAFRIYQGDTILGVGWSNTAANMDGFFRVVYDDGEPDTIRWDRTVATAARAAFLITSAQVARKDGFVTEGAMFGDAPQRGQTYVVAYISQGYQPGDVRSVLAKGYVYASVPLQIGQQVEPGPAGGPGFLGTVLGTNQAAGTLPTDPVPTGAIWRVRSYSAVLVTDANAGNRQFLLVIDDGTATRRVFAAQNNNTQAATLTRTWLWNLGTDLSTTTGASYVDTATVLPAYNLKNELLLSSGFNIRLVSTGTLAFTATDDFAGPFIVVEEWVMPN